MLRKFWLLYKMKKSQKTFIALLRGINVGGHNKIPMAELCSLCSDIGWTEVCSYIQSGNLIFTANTTAAALETALERAIERRFGFKAAVIVRAAEDWPSYIQGNPFLEASAKAANTVMLTLSKNPPKSDAAERLRERATNGENVQQVGDAVWIHFSKGVAKSKLSPGMLDRFIGSPVTTRNWRTVLRLGEL